MRDVIHRTVYHSSTCTFKNICKLLLFLLSFNVFVNDAQFNYNYIYVWLLINGFVLYVWYCFGQSFMFGAISDIKELARLLYDSELVLVNHQNCLKHNKSKKHIK